MAKARLLQQTPYMYLSTNTIVMILYLLTDCYGGDGGAMAEMFALTLIV